MFFRLWKNVFNITSFHDFRFQNCRTERNRNPTEIESHCLFPFLNEFLLQFVPVSLMKRCNQCIGLVEPNCCWLAYILPLSRQYYSEKLTLCLTSFELLWCMWGESQFLLVNWKPFTIFTKLSISDVWQSSEYASAMDLRTQGKMPFNFSYDSNQAYAFILWEFSFVPLHNIEHTLLEYWSLMANFFMRIRKTNAKQY